MQDVQDKYKVSSDKNKVMKDVKREVVKEININSSEDINIKEALRQHKLVKADYLNVRISNSTDSRVLFVLQFGQVVRIVNKNKEWTLIEYSDNKNVYIKGWVYTKYLSSFY